MFEVRENLAAIIRQLLRQKYGVSTDVHFLIPIQDGKGDMTTAVALKLSKQVGASPRDIASAIAASLTEQEVVQSCVVAGGGYVNVELKSAALLHALSSAKDASKPTPTRSEPPTIVEYSQPNIAKPLGIHHILGTFIGQAIANLHIHTGYKVIKWNYLGDWGTQFGKLAVAHEKWGGTKPIEQYTLDELLSLYVRFHEEVEEDATLEDAGREAFRKLEEGDQTLRAFWQSVLDTTKRSLAALYQRLNVSFDLDLSESFYEDKMGPVLKEGIEKGVFKEGEHGALIVTFPEETKMPPYLVRKGDGSTLYSTRDLAQMRYRIDALHPRAIYIHTDIAQKLHFEQLIATCRQLGWKLPEFENVLFGRMRFADKSMSTRKGNILKLEEVIGEAVKRADALIGEKESEVSGAERQELSEMMGIGSLAYGILSQNRKMDMVFDWKKVLTFEGNSAPYLQYTHARARSVLRKAEVHAFELPACAQDLLGKERALIRLLLSFRDAVEIARSERLPHKLATYLYALCQSYNAFYNDQPILRADEPQRGLRLAITFLTAEVLKTGAGLLTLRVPDRM